jgi:hypothetical protein
MKSIKICP